MRRITQYFSHLVISLLLFNLLGCAGVYNRASMNDPNWAPAFPKVTDNSQTNPGAIFNPGSAQMLFQDKKAHRIGDIITIVLTESTNASKNADTELDKESNLNLSEVSLLGNTTVGFSGGDASLAGTATTDRSFKAETDSKQSNNLQGTISVTVHEVYPNGNLAIKGEKWIALNQGSEFIRVAGIIRPEDISKDNQIASTKIANAFISYGGRGALAEANEEGWAWRFFNSGWWPF